MTSGKFDEYKSNMERNGLICAVGILVALGLVMLYSTSAGIGEDRFGDAAFFLKRQLLWLLIAAFGAIWIERLDYHRLLSLGPIIMGVSLLLLVLALIPGIGVSVHGSRRWIHLLGMSFQPSEFTKLASIIFLAGLFVRYPQHVKSLGFYSVILTVLALIFALIVAEPDFGTAVLIGGVYFLLYYAGGGRLRYLIVTVSLALPILTYLIVISPYRWNRVLAFLNPWKYADTIGYHVTQSLIALGSGGPWGVGLGEGKQKLGFLPEPYGDFIFSVLGEELGLVGTLFVLILFFLVFTFGVRIASRAKDKGGLLLGFGIAMLLGCQAVFNIAVVTASIPTKGIGLPFISFGGSSLFFALIGIGILINISKQSGDVEVLESIRDRVLVKNDKERLVFAIKHIP